MYIYNNNRIYVYSLSKHTMCQKRKDQMLYVLEELQVYVKLYTVFGSKLESK